MATAFNMMVVMTSDTLRYARRAPAIDAQAAPHSIPKTMANGMWMSVGIWKLYPAQAAPIAPTSN